MARPQRVVEVGGSSMEDLRFPRSSILSNARRRSVDDVVGGGQPDDEKYQEEVYFLAAA